MNGPDRRVLAAFIAAVVVGGTNSVAIRYSNDELPPFGGAAIRFAAAALLFAAYAVARRQAFPRGRALAGTLVYGVLSFAGAYGFFYWGLQRAPAALGSTYLAVVPLVTVFLAAAHGLERIRLRGMLGGAIAVVGVAVIFAEKLRADVALPYQLALLAGAICAAESSVVFKLLPRIPGPALNAVGMAAGAVVLIALAVAAGEAPPAPHLMATWLALGYLIVATLALFTLFVYVIRRWTVTATSYTFVLVPVVTVAVAAALRGEGVSPLFIAGAAVVGAGVYVGALSRPAAHPVPATPSPSEAHLR